MSYKKRGGGGGENIEGREENTERTGVVNSQPRAFGGPAEVNFLVFKDAVEEETERRSRGPFPGCLGANKDHHRVRREKVGKKKNRVDINVIGRKRVSMNNERLITPCQKDGRGWGG